MEVAIFVLFAGLLLLGGWVARRSAAAARFQPWIMIAGAIALVVLVWGSDEEVLGPRILLTAFAVLGLYRAAVLLRERRALGPRKDVTDVEHLRGFD